MAANRNPGSSTSTVVDWAAPITVVAWAPVLLRAWLGSEFAEQSAAAFRILALAALVGVLAPVAGAALQAYGRPDVIAKLYLVYLPLNVAVVVALVGALGVTGAALSMLLRALLDTSIVLAVALRTMQLRLATFAAGVWRTVVVVGVAGILLWLTPRTIAGVSLQASVAVGVLAIFVLGIWRWALTAPERALAWRLLTWSGS